LGAAGNPEIRTPHLDRLAAESVHFRRCFVQNPVCMPSRISFMSGRYPSSLGITHMGVPVPENLPLLSHRLGRAGYRCANIGKLHFLPHANRDHRELHPAYGFDHLQISDEPGCYDDAYRAWVRRRAPEELDHLSIGLPPATATWQRTMDIEDGIRHPEWRGARGARAYPGREDVTHSSFVGEETAAFLRNRGDGPFLCVAGFYSPHAPWVVPQRYLDLYRPESIATMEYPEGWKTSRGEAPPDAATQRSIRHGYYAMVSEVDEHVGKIMAVLEERGLSENTIVVFTSDHGEWLGTRGLYGKGYPGDDAVARVPLLIRFPRSWGIAPRREEGMVEAVDVLPTLLEAAGIPIPPAVQGRSLWPLIRGEAGGRDSALMEGNGWKSLRTETFHYLVHADGRESLFDLESDPLEYRDVAGEPERAAVLAELRHRLLRRLVEMERPLPKIWPY